MGKLGWLTIRNVPELNTDERGQYHALLKDFFKDHKNCPSCGGRGYTLKKKGKQVEETTVRYQGVAELEKLNQQGISLTEVIREILERKVWNRRRCKVCKGSRFVLREGEEQNVKAVAKGKKKSSN